MPVLSTGTARARIAFLMLLACMTQRANAQTERESEISVGLGGLVQTEASYGWIDRAPAGDERERLGFNLRRTRLRVNAGIGPRAGVFVHVDGDNGTFGILDAFVSYQANRQVRLRLGRMASAQPRAFILTPVIAMDATERAAIALLWNRGTLGTKGRDFGLDLRYATAHAEAVLFLHNGYGSFDRLRGTFQENIIGDVTGGSDRSLEDFAVSFYGAVRPEPLPGLEIGGFVGYNGNRNPSTAVDEVGRRYVSYSAHAYWGAEPGSQRVRLKADLIGIRYEEIPLDPIQHSVGLSFLGAVGIHRAAELFGRVEYFDPYVDAGGGRGYFATAGLSFSPSRLRGRPYPQERLTMAYNARIPDNDEEPVHQLVVLQIQFNF